MYLDKNGSFNKQKLSTFGYLSSGIPGTVAGLWEVHQKFGSLPWEELLEDAINYAENGFKVTPFMSDVLRAYNKKLSFYDETKNIFQKGNKEKPRKKGSKVVAQKIHQRRH